MKMDRISLGLRLPSPMVERLREEARKRQYSVTWIVRRLVERWLDGGMEI